MAAQSALSGLVAFLCAFVGWAQVSIRGPIDDPNPVRKLQTNTYPAEGLKEQYATLKYAHEAHADWPRNLNVLPAKDMALEAEVKRIVDSMTLEAKIAQMVQVGIPETDVASITAERGWSVGNLLSGPGAQIGTHQPYEWLNQAEVLLNTSAYQAGVKIPYIWGMDAIHGHNNQPTGVIFPHNIGLGAANDTELMKKIGEITAIQLNLVGVDWAFAPCVANPQLLRWGRVYEGYAAHPETIRRLSKAMILGLQGDPRDNSYLNASHVLASIKHWIGDGATEEGIDAGDTFLPEDKLIKEHALPYFDAIENGVATVMVSFSRYNGTKMHGHEYLLKTVLKETLGFDGIVISDFEGHQHVDGCDRWHCAQAVNAGLDVFMVAWGDDWDHFSRNTAEQVRNGTIPEERINDAATRIIRTKARLGLIDTVHRPAGPRPSPWQRADHLAQEGHYFGAPEHRAIGREAVSKSLVMLKNNGLVLPLDSSMRVAVVGRGGNSIALQCGGWTVDWLGSKENPNEMFGDATTIYGGIAEKGVQVDYSFNGTEGLSGDYDAIIVVCAENPYSEVEGDIRINTTISFAHMGEGDGWYDLSVLEAMRQQHPNSKIITVFISGRPLYTNRLINLSDAFVVAWLPGTEGGGIADVLFGEKNMTGKLPFDWPTDPCDASTNSGNYGGIWHIGGGLTYGYDRTMETLTEHRIDSYFLCEKYKSSLIQYTTSPPVEEEQEEQGGWDGQWNDGQWN